MNDLITPQALCLSIAFGELGTKELPGPAANQRIVRYLATVDPTAQRDEIPWCSAFLNWVCADARCKRTNNALARSWLKLPGVQTSTGIPTGAIVVFRRGQAAWQGHVALALHQIGLHTVVIGGNQANSVSVAAYRTADVLGWVLPTLAE